MRSLMIEHAAKITAINPSAARFTLEEMFGLVLVGVSILGNVFAARNLHSSLFSFRRPQCFSFDESYSGIGFAPCRASIIPTRACIEGPRSSADINSASIAACHSGACCFDFGSAMMYAAACFSVTSFLPFGG